MKHSFHECILVVPHNSLAQTPLLSPGPAQLAAGEQRRSSFQKVVVVFTGNSSICVQIGWLCVRHSGAVLDFSRLILLEMRSGVSNFSGHSNVKLMTFFPDLDSHNLWVWGPSICFLMRSLSDCYRWEILISNVQSHFHLWLPTGIICGFFRTTPRPSVN